MVFPEIADNTIPSKQRDQFFDILKGIAIILMLLGHSIQCGGGMDYYSSREFLDNPIFKLIYGFHMPLFTFVSGFLFFSSVQKRNICQLFKKLLFQIFIPLVAFSTLAFIASNINRITALWCIDEAKNALHSFVTSYWFLWTILYCAIVLGVSSKLKIDKLGIQVLIVAALYCIPDYFNTQYFKYLYPFFVLGYIVKKHQLINRIQNHILLGVASTATYLLLMLTLFAKSTYIYSSSVYVFQGSGVLFQIYNDVLRLSVGFFGVTACVTIMKYAYEYLKISKTYRIVADIGCKSMGIYCFQDLIIREIPYLLPCAPKFLFLSVVGTFCMVFIFSYSATVLFSKVHILNSIFLGGR